MLILFLMIGSGILAAYAVQADHSLILYAAAAIYLVVGTIAWGIADAIRRAVLPQAIIAGGFWGTVRSKLFWALGPQAWAMAVAWIAVYVTAMSLESNGAPEAKPEVAAAVEASQRPARKTDEAITETSADANVDEPVAEVASEERAQAVEAEVAEPIIPDGSSLDVQSLPRESAVVPGETIRAFFRRQNSIGLVQHGQPQCREGDTHCYVAFADPVARRGWLVVEVVPQRGVAVRSEWRPLNEMPWPAD